MIRFKKIYEDAFETAAGVVVVSQDKQQVLTVWPTNEFGGYKFTFPKGHLDKGESPEQAAQREFEEETGISRSHLDIGESMGSFEGTATDTQYFMGVLDNDDIVKTATPPVNPSLGFPEAEKVEWMWIEDFLDNTTSDRDRKIIMMLKNVLGV